METPLLIWSRQLKLVVVVVLLYKTRCQSFHQCTNLSKYTFRVKKVKQCIRILHVIICILCSVLICTVTDLIRDVFSNHSKHTTLPFYLLLCLESSVDSGTSKSGSCSCGRSNENSKSVDKEGQSKPAINQCIDCIHYSSSF